jgi:hypothetical protein
MATCPAKSYPLSPADAITICDKIHVESGIFIDPTESTGTAVAHGVTLAWSIHEDQIDISILSKPFFVPCATIYTQLDELFAK